MSVYEGRQIAARQGSVLDWAFLFLCYYLVHHDILSSLLLCYSVWVAIGNSLKYQLVASCSCYFPVLEILLCVENELAMLPQYSRNDIGSEISVLEK